MITYDKHPTEINNLICFWDFQEQKGSDKIAKGPNQYELSEMKGPIAVANEGVFGSRSLHIEPGQWLELNRKHASALNICGKQAQVTVIAWIKWRYEARCQFVAGMWNESNNKRQFGLFLNLHGRYDSWRNVHGHVSSNGGPTPGQRYCVTYSTGSTEIVFDQWYSIAMSYDGNYSKVYLNRILDERQSYNPYHYSEGIFEGGEDGSDFTVAACSVNGKMDNFFGGLLGGVAVYNRALTIQEVRQLGSPINAML